ncbi:MAG TPA: DUF6010 family protein [Gemmatimonadales bacterium]|nr:DUF6010 family protein [Gemmatimonadales bacterium]
MLTAQFAPPLTTREFGALLRAGVILGGLFVALAYAVPRHTRRILAGVLVVAALVYVAFAALAGASPRWLLLELLGVGVYGGLALRSLRGSMWWLAAAWALHPVWDVALHYAGPGGAFAPTWWTVPCLSWDLVTAGWIAWRTIGKPAPVARVGG